MAFKDAVQVMANAVTGAVSRAAAVFVSGVGGVSIADPASTFAVGITRIGWVAGAGGLVDSAGVGFYKAVER